jgi:hypothetical protein
MPVGRDRPGKETAGGPQFRAGNGTWLGRRFVVGLCNVANTQSGERSEDIALFISMTVECRMGAKIARKQRPGRHEKATRARTENGLRGSEMLTIGRGLTPSSLPGDAIFCKMGGGQGEDEDEMR